MPTPARSPRRQTWHAYRQSKMAVAALWIVGSLVLVAVLAPLLATHLPLYCVYDGEVHFPAFAPEQQDSLPDLQSGKMIYRQYRYIKDWRRIQLKSVIWAPIPYSPATPDPVNAGFVSPFGYQRNPDPAALPGAGIPLRFRHWLGTTLKGEDVLAHLIHGTRISLSVGIVAVGLAALLGTLLGSLAGYYGNTRLRIRRSKLTCLLAGLIPAWFYGIYLRRFALADAAATDMTHFLGQVLLSLLIASGVLAACWTIAHIWARNVASKKTIGVPLDSLISRLMEVLNSLPLLLLLLSISYLFARPSLLLVMAIIGITGWTGIARLIRGEFLRIIQLDYMESARALGIPERALIWKHAFPNGIAPLLVVVAFGMGAAIITESALSFLNIGVPNDISTWGKLLNETKLSFQRAWWVALPPSFAIFLTVFSFNLIGERLRDVLDPRTQTEP